MNKKNKTTAIIVAGGKGKRMKSKLPKAFLLLDGKPILALTAAVFHKCAAVDEIIIVVPRGYEETVIRDVVTRYRLTKVKAVVRGGKERTDSVRNALAMVEADTDTILVQDGVRPFATDALIRKGIFLCIKKKAVITAVPAKDTIKTVKKGMVTGTPDRSELWQVQTPQIFDARLLKKAYEKATAAQTDDARLVELTGKKVAVCEGTYDNIKITTPEDLALAETILQLRRKK